MFHATWQEHLFLTLLLLCALSDLRMRKIPHYFLYMGFLVCTVFRYQSGGVWSLLPCLFCSLSVLLAGYPLAKRHAFGAGDIKLLSLLAFYTGFNGLLPLLFRVFLMGSLLGIFKMLSNAKNKLPSSRTTIPFAVPVFFGVLVHLGG